MFGAVYSPENARFRRLRSSTAISESIPRSKNPTVGAGADGRRSTACSSLCRNDTSRFSRSSAGTTRSRDSTSSCPSAASGPESVSAASSSSISGGRLSAASANTGQSTPATTDAVTSWRTSRSNARKPCCGLIHRVPEASSCRPIRSRCSSASPSPDHAPQAMAWPASPNARRWAAS